MTGVGPAIEAAGLTKRYGATVALDDLALTVGRGEVFGFLGPNGAGKTTAVKLLLGLARPTGGGATVLGAPLGDRETRRRIGYLPELFRYQPWLTAREVLGLHCELVRLERSARPAEIAATLRTVGLAARADSLVGTFSKGMQQRLGLGVALLGSPDLVILDEPTSALDPIGRLDVRRIIAGLGARGAAVFLDSHLLTKVERVCDRVAILDRGRVVASGRIDALTAAGDLRIRVSDLPDDALAGLRSFVHGDGSAPEGADAAETVRRGTAGARPGAADVIRRTEDGIVLTGLDSDRVPDVVAAIVAAGGRVHAVEPVRVTLEDRFLDLVAAGRS